MSRKGKVFWLLLTTLIWSWFGYLTYLTWIDENVGLPLSILSSILLLVVALTLSLVIRWAMVTIKEKEYE